MDISINLFDILKSKRTLIFNFPWLVNSLRKIYLETYIIFLEKLHFEFSSCKKKISCYYYLYCFIDK